MIQIKPTKIIKLKSQKNKHKSKQMIIKDIRGLLRTIYNQHLDKITEEYLLNIKSKLMKLP
jgi:hypothetical protein